MNVPAPATSRRRAWRLVFVLAGAALLLAAGWAAWRWQPEPWAQRHLEQAQRLAASQQGEAARAELRIVLRRLPRHGDARWQLIQLELQQQRFEQAYLELKAFTELFPDHAESWLLVASLINSGCLLDEAEVAADHALDAAPAHLEARALRASIRLRRARFFGAAVDARAAVDRAPGDAAMWSVLSQSATVMEGPAAGAAMARRGLDAAQADPLLRVVLAKRLIESGQAAAAMQTLEQVIADPQAGEARRTGQLLLARLAVRHVRTGHAATVLDAVLRERPADVEATIGRALLEAAAGRTPEALARIEPLAPLVPAAFLQGLRTALEQSGGDRAVTRRLLSDWAESGLVAPRGGEPPAPQRIHRGAQRQRGEIAESHAMVWPGTLAELRRDSDRAIQQQNWDAAQAVAQRAARVYPGSVIGPWIAGVIELAQQHNAAAAQRFLEALAAAPRSALVTKGLAQVWVREADAATAGDRLMELVGRDPGFAFARRHAANTYLNARRPDLAEAALRRGTETPGDAGAFRDLAAFYLELDRAGDALALCRDALARFPADAPLQALQAQLLVRSGDTDGAIAQYEALLRQRPDRTADAVALARLLLARPARRAQALELLGDASFDAPADLAVVDSLGWSWLLAGDAARALPWIEAAVLAAPDRPDLRYHLAAAYAQAGRKADARNELKAVLESGEAFAEQAEARRLMESLGGKRPSP